MKEIKNVINITDLSTEEIDHLIEIADSIEANPRGYSDICRAESRNEGQDDLGSYRSKHG